MQREHTVAVHLVLCGVNVVLCFSDKIKEIALLLNNLETYVQVTQA